MIEGRDSTTGLPIHMIQEFPKPGSAQGTKLPEDFIPHIAKPFHQSPSADVTIETYARTVGGIMDL